ALLYFYLLRNNTDWFRNQFVKYTSLGTFLILLTLLTHLDLRFFESSISIDQLIQYLHIVIRRKAFYGLFFIGMISVILVMTFPRWKIFKSLTVDVQRLQDLMTLVLC